LYYFGLKFVHFTISPFSPLQPYFILDEKDKEDKNKVRSAAVALEMLRRQAAGDSLEQVLEIEAADDYALVANTGLPGFAMAEDDEDADIVSAAKYTKKMDVMRQEEEQRLDKMSQGKEMPNTYGGTNALDFL